MQNAQCSAIIIVHCALCIVRSKVDGVLIIDKPAGITSHDVVARVRRILKTKRVGHTGTLDPFATGVLVLLIGQATRLAQFLDKDEKEYEAVVKFGFETDTGDKTGLQIGECGMPNEDVAKRLSLVNWEEAFDPFRGDIEQIPPMYSAKKVAGKKLYELARSGETVDRQKIRVAIHNLELAHQFQISDLRSEIKIRVACSAGTYIRTLAEDIGRKIAIPAHVAELRRTKAGKFRIGQSVTLDKLADLAEPHKSLIPMHEAVSHLPIFLLPDERVEKTKSGLSTRVFDVEFSDGEAVQMQVNKGDLVAIGFYNKDESSIQPKVVLI